MKIENKNGEFWVFCFSCDQPLPSDLMILENGRYFCRGCANPQIIKESLTEPTETSEEGISK